MHDTPVLVTGATGFIGSRLAERLARDEGAKAFNVSAEVSTWRTFMGYYGELCGKEPKGFPVLAARLLAAANRIPGVDTGMSVGFRVLSRGDPAGGGIVSNRIEVGS